MVSRVYNQQDFKYRAELNGVQSTQSPSFQITDGYWRVQYQNVWHNSEIYNERYQKRNMKTVNERIWYKYIHKHTDTNAHKYKHTHTHRNVNTTSYTNKEVNSQIQR